MNEPNYKSCNSDELQNILSHIDHDAWPDRVLKIKALLADRAQDEESKIAEVVDKTNAVDIFSPRQIFLGSYLGGPVAALYYLKSNYKALNNTVAEKNVLFAGGIFIALLTVSLLYIPDNFPRLAIPLFYSGIALLISENLQINREKEAASKEYRFCSSWRVAKVAIVSLVGYFIVAFGLLYAIESSRLTQLANTPESESLFKDQEMKFYVVSRKDIRTIYNQLENSGTNQSFAIFAFFPNNEGKNNHVEIQFGIENNRIGLDWVLLGENKEKDKNKFIDLARTNGYKVKNLEMNDVKYLRVESGDLVGLMEQVMIQLYDVSPSKKMELIANKFKVKEFPFSLAELYSDFYMSESNR
ncbi:MAG: hypothetical protein COA86_03445 [Kangiella sp.]|nr:MAG: hypothetical protein COA86_03445 [Kangiella sp.]